MQGTGEAGLDVNETICGPPEWLTVVEVTGALVVVGAVEVGDDDPVVVETGIVVDVVVVLVVVVDPSPFFPLLQALRARIAATEARTRAIRGTKGGYGHTPPYPGQRCRAS